jgi:hypothetical protein
MDGSFLTLLSRRPRPRNLDFFSPSDSLPGDLKRRRLNRPNPRDELDEFGKRLLLRGGEWEEVKGILKLQKYDAKQVYIYQ